MRIVPYDLIRQEFIALPEVLMLVVVLAGFLSSQDDPPLTSQHSKISPD
jgi:hypothetical protein